MHDYDDMLARAIRYRFAPTIAGIWNDLPVKEFINPSISSVMLPMRADTALFYEKDMAAFGVKGHVTVKGETLSGYKFFSTREISTNRDAAHIISHFFDALKEEFLSALANNELEKYGVGKI